MADAGKKSIFKRWWFWLIVIVVVIAAANSGKDNGGTTSSSNSTTSVTSNAMPGMNEVVQTDYFEVTVNSLKFSKTVGSNEYLRQDAGDGNIFAIVNVTFKNTDTEGRSLTSGDLIATYNGKELLFDNAEVVLEDGYITFDTLNPLAKITGNVVFKISEELQEGLSYNPPRSNVKIKLN